MSLDWNTLAFYMSTWEQNVCQTKKQPPILPLCLSYECREGFYLNHYILVIMHITK